MISGLVRAARSPRSSCAWSDAAAAKPSNTCSTRPEGTVSLLAARICERYAVPTESPNSQPMLRILSDAPLRHPALLGYLASRGIVPGIAAAYCREVRYQVRSRCFFAIGFRNDCGGWELRSERFKGSSSPKQITTFDHQSDKVIVFEGFMDFLACLSMKHPAPLGIDAAVLNSVVNLPKALLSSHGIRRSMPFWTTTRRDVAPLPN